MGATFFGKRTSINRVSFLRSNPGFIKDVANFPNTRIIFFKKSPLTKALQVIAHKTVHETRIWYLPLRASAEVTDLMKRWAALNADQSPDIRSELKFTAMFLGIDEDPNSDNSPFLSEPTEFKEMFVGENFSGIPILAVDISESTKFQGLIDKLSTTNPQPLGKMDEILNLNTYDATIFAYAKMFLDWLSKNQFCPGCGSMVRPIWAGTKLQCTNESKITNSHGQEVYSCPVRQTKVNNVCFPRMDPVVIIALRNSEGSKILLGHNARRRQLDKKFYSCFSGFMEPGETIESTALREVWEETGLHLHKKITIIKSQPWPFPCCLMVGCIGTTDKKDEDKITTQLDKELDNLGWFDASYVADLVYDRPTDGKIKLPQRGSVAFELIKMVVDECITTKL